MPRANGSAIKACARGEKCEAALRVFVECQQWCAADATTYSALIDAYASCGQWERALGVLDLMKREKVVPDLQSYSTVT